MALLSRNFGVSSFRSSPYSFPPVYFPPLLSQKTQNLVSYLCQLDRLESFTILQNPRIDYTDLSDLATNHRTLLLVGVGPSKGLTEQQINSFNDSRYQPNVRIYKRPVESSGELERYMS